MDVWMNSTLRLSWTAACLFAPDLNNSWRSEDTNKLKSGGKKDQDTANFKRLKHRFVLTVLSELTQSVLMVQNFNPICSTERLSADKKEPPCRLSFKTGCLRWRLQGGCVFNNGWLCLGTQPVFFISRVFPAEASKVSRVVPSSTVDDSYALSLALTQVFLANYSSSPPRMASDIWCYVHLFFLRFWWAPAEQSSLRDSTLFLLFNLCSLLFFCS